MGVWLVGDGNRPSKAPQQLVKEGTGSCRL